MSSKPVDLYKNYGHFTEEVLKAIRKETYGEDLGQNGWTTVDEYNSFISWLGLVADDHLVEVGSGSGGPALYIARKVGCRVTGIDANEGGIAAATQSAVEAKLTDRLSFRMSDADAPLPFVENAFDALICIDAMNHFLNRLNVLCEWNRILGPGSRALFTDPVLITGPVTNEELALRSSIGRFLFVPPGINEKLIENAGFHLIEAKDASENAALVSGRWHQARQRYRDALLKIEGQEHFEGLQKFFDAVHRLTSERRLSRVVYVVEKPVT